eukprot:TRINITY_DN11363_c0_g1_i1.p1 TRINITY_DN11363_c0_g1~~TRINITY_DN11363_c0_g1_i1.p1  ORF type:complete len:243 (+),score=49.21 TRINITY_DN11363_c0_g1_i1:101-730(+)
MAWDHHGFKSDRKPCQLPSQYSVEFVKYRISPDHVIQDYTRGIKYIDSEAKKMRFDRASSNESSQYTTWIDFGNQQGWAFDRATKMCHTFVPEWKWHGNGFPEDTQLAGQRFVAGVSVDTWAFASKSKSDLMMLAGLTTDTCIPVNFVIIDKKQHQPVLISEMWNYVPNLPPFSFDLPTECQTMHANSVFRSRPLPENIRSEIRMLHLH